MTNYEKHFGTPEKAAQTIARITDDVDCSITDAICAMFNSCLGCPCNTCQEYPGFVQCGIRTTSLSTDEFTEWLRSEVQSDE